MQKTRPPPHLNSAEHAHDQEPHRAEELECRQAGHGPQDHGHIDGALGGVVRGAARVGGDVLQTSGAEDDGHEAEVADDPEEDDAGTEALVVILLLLAGGEDSLLDGGLDDDLAHLGLVLGVQIAVVRGDVDVDLAARLEHGGWQLLRLVVTFRTPCDIMGVAEGVDVEDVDVGRGEEQVLDEGGEHVPGIEEQERHDEPEDVRGGQGDDQRVKDLVLENVCPSKVVQSYLSLN